MKHFFRLFLHISMSCLCIGVSIYTYTYMYIAQSVHGGGEGEGILDFIGNRNSERQNPESMKIRKNKNYIGSACTITVQFQSRAYRSYKYVQNFLTFYQILAKIGKNL